MPDDCDRVAAILPEDHIQQAANEERRFEASVAVRQRCFDLLEKITAEIEQAAQQPQPRILTFEPRLIGWVFALGRLLFQLFLTCAEERYEVTARSILDRGQRVFRKRPRQPRQLGTFFGKTRYWRRYYVGDDGHGIYPLDEELGLGADGFTWGVVSLATRLATKMAFLAAAQTLAAFLGWAPAKKTIEEWTLGLGERAYAFQEQAPPPPDDGEVLIIQIDSKGIPTATEAELKKRKGRRRPNPHPESKRHRGRARRKNWAPRRRRKKGDKSKNAKMATLVVMYTLKTVNEDGQVKQLGPLNLRIFGSFAPKKYAFQVARREAIKRGFGPDSGKLIQFVNDGDDDLETYRKEFFGAYPPDRTLITIDLPHVLEYLWSAGTAVHAEGSGALASWVKQQKSRLFQGRPDLILRELRDLLRAIPTRGPGNAGRRERLEKTIRYIDNRRDRLNYKLVRQLDLELASGIVEGAVKHVIGYRFDYGGMRWIRERADALLQLRCIEINGQWNDFIAWAHDAAWRKDDNRIDTKRARLRRRTPLALPVTDGEVDYTVRKAA